MKRPVSPAPGRTNDACRPENQTSHCRRNPRRTGWLTLCLVLFSLPLALAQDVLLGLTSNGGQDGRGTAFSIKSDGTGFALLKRFADWGRTPTGDLTPGSDGHFYGVASLGGTHNAGTIFRVATDGAVTVLHHFLSATDGSTPGGSLVQATDGNFYGTTQLGGQNTKGTIFRITPGGAFSVLRHLSGPTDGGNPFCTLTPGNDGLLYGMTNTGGANGAGTIFRISTGGAFATLRSFAAAADGRNPYGSLTKGPDGSFYGMTYGGGLHNVGTAFRYVPGGSFTVLRHFQTAGDGGSPRGSLTFGNDGHLYGLTQAGGLNNHGTIFRLKLNKEFNVIRHFRITTDGAFPWGSLTKGADGSFYGMTKLSGGSTNGIIFRITTGGGFTLMKQLTTAATGGSPVGSLARGSDGNFYGMTSEGGNNLFGTIFRITPANAFTVLAHLSGATHGNAPQENLVQGSDGAIYGTAATGGKFNYGTLFRICGGVTTVLKHLDRTPDGAYPKGALVRGADGNYYGTTSFGGANSNGTIFRISTGGVYSVLRHLKAATDGGFPEGSLVQGADGNFYGLARSGGLNGGGTIFQVNPTTNAYTVLRHLSPATDGSNSLGGLIAGPDGYFYGMTNMNSRIFKINPAGNFVVLHTLAHATEGSTPKGNLVRGADGFFYGTTTSGGSTSSMGTVFKMSASGQVTVLKRFNGATDGGRPAGTLLQGTDGAFYGTAGEGGNFKAGTLFRVTAGGAFSVLRHLNLANDGGMPLGGFIIQKNALVANVQPVSTTEDTPKAIALTGAGGAALTYTVVTAPRHGKLGGTGNLRTYAPNANFNGSDSFTFVVSVGCLTSAPVTVSISVSAVNDAPVLASIGNRSIPKGSLLSFTALATEVDAGQTRTFSLVNAPAGATIGAGTGTFAWTPAVSGTFSFTVKVADNGSPLLADTETITVAVTSAARLAAEDGAGDETDVQISLHPNPAAQTLYVGLATATAVEGTAVLDASGRTHLLNTHQVRDQNHLELNVSTLKPGLYLLRLHTAGGLHVQRFLKQ